MEIKLKLKMNLDVLNKKPWLGAHDGVILKRDCFMGSYLLDELEKEDQQLNSVEEAKLKIIVKHKVM